jgi:hypothetical protein
LKETSTLNKTAIKFSNAKRPELFGDKKEKKRVSNKTERSITLENIYDRDKLIQVRKNNSLKRNLVNVQENVLNQS